MKTSILAFSRQAQISDRSFWLDQIARKMVYKQLSRITEGEIVIRENNRDSYFGKISSEFPLRVHIDVHHSSLWSDVAFGGTPGSGEAYMKGSWSCSNLTNLVRIFVRNRHVLDSLDQRFTRLQAPLQKLLHWLSRNTRSGSRRNIGAHYDLGNDLFRLFLDPTMMYSCAYYPTAEATLEQASLAKLEMICQKLQLTPQDHLLEIGTGWGGLAIYAAQNYGCKVTTTTISQQQYDMAKQRIEEAGLEQQITLLFSDYRDLQGQYDKLVSVEMIEAIGHQYLQTYFAKCSSLLKADGVMLLQAITIADQLYEAARKDVDFIKKYIFPGGFLPSVTAMSQAISQMTDMKMAHLHDIGPHYARTLADWRNRFFAQIDAVRQQGYSDAFVRMWEYYLCYCEGGFIERDIGTVQMLLTKPQSRLLQ